MKKKILVVEDDKDMQKIYADVIKNGFDVTIVGDTTKAQKELDNHKYDLMVLDIILPKEPGDTFFVKLKQNPKYKNLKVIVVTVLGDIVDKLKMIDSNVECLPKPFDKKELLELINKKLAE